jgi:hypothetical protein
LSPLSIIARRPRRQTHARNQALSPQAISQTFCPKYSRSARPAFAHSRLDVTNNADYFSSRNSAKSFRYARQGRTPLALLVNRIFALFPDSGPFLLTLGAHDMRHKPFTHSVEFPQGFIERLLSAADLKYGGIRKMRFSPLQPPIRKNNRPVIALQAPSHRVSTFLAFL